MRRFLYWIKAKVRVNKGMMPPDTKSCLTKDKHKSSWKRYMTPGRIISCWIKTCLTTSPQRTCGINLGFRRGSPRRRKLSIDFIIREDGPAQAPRMCQTLMRKHSSCNKIRTNSMHLLHSIRGQNPHFKEIKTTIIRFRKHNNPTRRTLDRLLAIQIGTRPSLNCQVWNWRNRVSL